MSVLLHCKPARDVRIPCRDLRHVSVRRPSGTFSGTPTKENAMSFTDKVKDKAQELEGKGKQKVGDATGDRSMQAEGVKDEKSGQVKQVGEKVKDVFK
jgi:uncharacterized protein YjbJ (UPF0337 family)